MSGSVVWFRRDLRVHDHPALAAAMLEGNPRALFVLDPVLTNGKSSSPRRNWFLLASLAELRESLATVGVPLTVVTGNPRQVVAGFVTFVEAQSVHVSRDYAPYGRSRDADVAVTLANVGVRLFEHPGVLITEPASITNENGAPFTVFSAFHRRFLLHEPRPLVHAEALDTPVSEGSPVQIMHVETEQPEQAPEPGERAARGRLRKFAKEGLATYAETRDNLAREGTSRLSQDLKFGLLSPVEVLAACRGSEKFVSELAWREFAAYLLWHFPRLRHGALKSAYDHVAWRVDPAALVRWQTGTTGFGLVDAAMCQLARTGFMPNRARMVAASFLAKDLLIDWREGCAFFMRQLIDGDVANNSLGWQWSASTGPDAAPYFRVMNPELQAARFDPTGSYRSAWLGTEPQPAPIVDHREARLRAIATFQEALRTTPVGQEHPTASGRRW